MTNYLYEVEKIESISEYVQNCKNKLKNSKLEDEWAYSNFINISDKIFEKYPLIWLEDLIEDYVSGINNKIILKTYGFAEQKDFVNIFSDKTLLDFKGKRTTSGANSKTKNLQKTNMFQKYQQYRETCNFFKTELEELLSINISKALILLMLINEKKEINKKEIQINFKNTYEKYKQDFPILTKKNISNSIEDKINKISLERIDEITTSLIGMDGFEHNFIQNETFKMENFHEKIIHQILQKVGKEIDGVRKDKIENDVIVKIPILKFIPRQKIFEEIYNTLVERNILKIEIIHENKSPQGDVVFSINNFERNDRYEDEQFFGRKNDPIDFVFQLQSLEKGDFDDKDDQVTRIASLSLTQPGITSYPKESLAEFDYVVDLSNFHPNKEQRDVMKNIDFKIKSKKMHVKVMLNEKIELELIEKIKKEIDKDDQAILISFKRVDPEIIDEIGDHIIQIVNKEGMLEWAKTVPYLPSRTGSVVKIKKGRHIGKIGKISNINYVSGATTFSLIPDTGIEYSTKIGNLEEIELFESEYEEIESVFKRYAEFLELISKQSEKHIFEKTIFDSKIGKIKNISNIEDDEKEFAWEMNTNNHITEINLKDIDKIDCTCEHWTHQGKLKTFCEHIILLLNEKCITEDWIDETWDEGNYMQYFLKNIGK